MGTAVSDCLVRTGDFTQRARSVMICSLCVHTHTEKKEKKLQTSNHQGLSIGRLSLSLLLMASPYLVIQCCFSLHNVSHQATGVLYIHQTIRQMLSFG